MMLVNILGRQLIRKIHLVIHKYSACDKSGCFQLNTTINHTIPTELSKVLLISLDYPEPSWKPSGSFCCHSSDMLWSHWRRLAPTVVQSGSQVFHGKILKECNQHIKWILVQCAHVHIRYCQNSSITRLYNRVMKKKGKAKATVAASRKMLTCIWHMQTKGERFKYRD